MGEAETLGESRSSFAAPLIFFTVIAFQITSWWLHELKRKASKTDKEVQLRGEIKQLLKEASALSQPSTFAQSAKLRRLAAAKEKELANYQEGHSKEIKMSYDLYLKALFISKVLLYCWLIVWFWKSPVATVSAQLVQPFGKVLSWKAGAPSNDNIMVGIIPWLIVSTRVSKFVNRLLK